MAGLKSFLYGVAPILGVTGAVLYERQRALVSLGVLKAAKGRGPGSGVPLTAENVAAVIISVLVTDNLAEVDERVVNLINAPPRTKDRNQWIKAGRPTFCTGVAAVLSGGARSWPLEHSVGEIRVDRFWTGIISDGFGQISGGTTEYSAKFNPSGPRPSPIKISAVLDIGVIQKLEAFTQGALSQAAVEDDE